jgi:uncharacterized protein with PIN domain
MILDTSALIAILRFEAEAPEFARIIEQRYAVSYLGRELRGSRGGD